MIHPIVRAISDVLHADPRYPTREWVNFDCPYCGAKERLGVCVNQARVWCFRCSANPAFTEFLRSLGLSPALLLGLKAPTPLESVQDRLRPRDKKGDASPLDLEGYERLRAHGEAPGKVAEKVRSYLKGRNVDLETWEVGISTDARLLGRAVWMFREFDVPVYFQGRAVVGSQVPKTINPRAGEGWPRGEVLFGHNLLEYGMRVAIGEGPFDAVALSRLDDGLLGTCLLGKNITPWQLNLLRERGVETVYLVLDQEETATTAKLAGRLSDEGFDVWVPDWAGYPDLADPSSIGPDECTTLLATSSRLDRRSRLRLALAGSRTSSERRSRVKRSNFSRSRNPGQRGS